MAQSNNVIMKLNTRNLKLFASQLSPSHVTVTGYFTYQSDGQVKPAIYQGDGFYRLVSEKCKL